MAEHRAVRMGIDVGGTYTKCVAMDNLTHEIIGKNEVKTTHDDKDGVAAGVVQSFKNCMAENDIAPEDVVFVAHSTTQATNAFIEGDVASVGVIGVAGGGLEGFLAKRQLNLKDIVLDEKVGRKIPVHNRFLKKKEMTDEKINAAIKELCGEGSQVIVASMAFGVDNMDEEVKIHDLAEAQGLPVSMASDITKLYGLTRRTRTAAINASILPKMMATANATESSVRNAGVTVPLMIMRGDGGVMEISEMRKRPILTALSGPAASVMGSLMYLRASNAIYFEVGGTTTNIGVIKNGRPGVDYAQIGGHDTYINSLDVRILGCAGGSMVRINDHGVEDVGPRSAHIAGCEYACFTPEEEIDAGPLTIEMLSPKPGDPSDYVAVKLASGKRICFTNTDAANVLGLIDEKYFAHGNASAARKCMQPVADKLGITVEELATQILDKDFEKVNACINALADKYQLDHDAMKLVGCGGGAASLVPYCAKKMGLQYSIPENAEVISSIGVALSMVRDVVERVIPNPTQEDIKEIIEYGRLRNVEIIPEIEFPAHMLSAVAAYPWLCCTGEQHEVPVQHFISRDLLCVGKESSYQFLKDVLDETVALFPSHYINIGGDEAVYTRWEECPRCQEVMKREGLTKASELQGYLTNVVSDMMKEKGRTVIGWKIKILPVQ